MIKSLCMIDDEEIDVYQVGRLIKRTKNVEKFYSFADGKEALDHFKNFQESQKKFDGYFPPSVVLLDINMPRMNGFDFLEQIQHLPEDKKCNSVILMLTSSSQDRDKERAAEFPIVKDLIVKPFTENHLEDVIRFVTDESLQ